jgi:putative ABC transport system ATP-binding protein
MLKLSNITKVFNAGTVNEKIALDNVSLTVTADDFITVIGGNGAGKSTLLNIIGGSLSPDAGEISLDGKDITSQVEHVRAAHFARVFQDPMTGTAASMAIEENLALAFRRGKRRGLRWAITKPERASYRDMLAALDLGLEDRLGVKAGLLSGGQRQALSLLMATLQKPRVLLLDEHTAALDPKTAKKVMAVTNELTREKKIPAVMITHNMNDAIAYGNKLIMMNNGNIIYVAEKEEKAKLKIHDLLEKFEQASEFGFANDRMLLI